MAQVLLEECAIETKLGDVARADFAADAALKLCAAESDVAAIAWDRRAAIAAKSNQWERAQDAARRALRCRRQRAADAPQDPGAKRALGAALARAGETAIGAKDYANARRLLQENLDLRLALAEAAPGEQGPARDLALGIEQVGRLAAARGDTAGARAAWEEELALAESVFAPDNYEGARFCAIVESLIASLGGPDAQTRRASALARLDRLAELGQLTGRDVALRAQLWKG
jgi:tetratricopeptide (TPR) repeat protein